MLQHASEGAPDGSTGADSVRIDTVIHRIVVGLGLNVLAGLRVLGPRPSSLAEMWVEEEKADPVMMTVRTGPQED